MLNVKYAYLFLRCKNIYTCYDILILSKNKYIYFTAIVQNHLGRLNSSKPCLNGLNAKRRVIGCLLFSIDPITFYNKDARNLSIKQIFCV